MSGIEDGARSLLRLLDVRLVEGVDAEDGAGDRRRQLEAEELGAEVVRRGDVDLDVLPVGAVCGLPCRRHEPPAILAGRLGDQLLEPQSEAARILEGDLVAPLLPARAQREAELQAGIPVGEPAGVVHLLGSREQPAEVDARERRGYEPEDRERRVAPADRRLAGDGLDAALLRELLERRARVGDDEEGGSDRLPARSQRWSK